MHSHRPHFQKLTGLFCLLFLLNLWFPLAGPALQTGEDGRWTEVCHSSLTVRNAATNKTHHKDEGTLQHCPYCLSQLPHKLMTAAAFNAPPLLIQYPEAPPLQASGLVSLLFLSVFDTRAPPSVI